MKIVQLLGTDSPNCDSAFRDLVDSESSYDANVGTMMLGLVDALTRDESGPILFASIHHDRELWLQYSAPNGASAMITAKIDSPDFGPFEHGLPRFHYRLSYRVRESNDIEDQLPIEERARSIELACAFIDKAIVEARRRP